MKGREGVKKKKKKEKECKEAGGCGGRVAGGFQMKDILRGWSGEG